MAIEYTLLNPECVIGESQERMIQKDLEWIQSEYPDLKNAEQKVLYLVDAQAFEKTTSQASRIIGIQLGTPKIYQTDGCIVGSYTTEKPIEQLSLDEVLVYSKERENTLLRSDMLTRLHELAVEKAGYAK